MKKLFVTAGVKAFDKGQVFQIISIFHLVSFMSAVSRDFNLSFGTRQSRI